MIRTAFCDDELSVLNELSSLLNRYCAEHGKEIEYTAFQSPLELLAAVERGTRFDVILMDVLMPGENGIEASAEIRSYDSNVRIIFLTSSPEFAVQSYQVRAYSYQLKPVQEGSFFSLMDSVISECENDKASSFILRCKSGIARIEPRQVEYCEVIHRTRFIHLINGKVLESIGSMDELSDRLAQFGCFLRPHRSYLINLDHIQNLSYRAITMACRIEIPIPRGKYGEIKDRYLEYAFRNGQVII
ncbi:MAG: LytTR family DNA-binding domain-containing protein [Oscillospiraceae bacterium]|nr:LytTR family DNA-binding domain-containing protein [Oscillospiraceae bacterium]